MGTILKIALYSLVTASAVISSPYRALAQGANDFAIEYPPGRQPFDVLDEDALVIHYMMGDGEKPGDNGINDKNFAIASCADHRKFVSHLFQVRTDSSGSYGRRYYVVTCKQ